MEKRDERIKVRISFFLSLPRNVKTPGREGREEGEKDERNEGYISVFPFLR